MPLAPPPCQPHAERARRRQGQPAQPSSLRRRWLFRRGSRHHRPFPRRQSRASPGSSARSFSDGVCCAALVAVPTLPASTVATGDLPGAGSIAPLSSLVFGWSRCFEGCPRIVLPVVRNAQLPILGLFVDLAFAQRSEVEKDIEAWSDNRSRRSPGRLDLGQPGTPERRVDEGVGIVRSNFQRQIRLVQSIDAIRMMLP